MSRLKATRALLACAPAAEPSRALEVQALDVELLRCFERVAAGHRRLLPGTGPSAGRGRQLPPRRVGPRDHEGGGGATSTCSMLRRRSEFGFLPQGFNPETKLENAVRFEEKLDLEPFCHRSKNFDTASSETVQVHLDRCGDACRHSQYRAVTTGRLCARRPISGLDVTTHALKKPI